MKNPKEINQFEKHEELIPDQKEQLSYWDYCHSLRETIQVLFQNGEKYSIHGIGIPSSSCSLERVLEILPIDEQGCIPQKNVQTPSLKKARQGFDVTPTNHVKTDRDKKIYYKCIVADPIKVDKYCSNGSIITFPIQQNASEVKTGIEYLVNAITYLLDGKAAKTTVLMLSGKFANTLEIEGYEYKGHIDYLVQASEAVGQYKLLDYYQDHFKDFSNILINNYSTYFTLSLCTCPFDAKFDNFQVDELAPFTIDITGIDSDSSCFEPYEIRSKKDNKGKIHKVNIRSEFFLFPHLNHEYTKALAKKIFSDSLELQTLKILKSLHTFQQHFSQDVLPAVLEKQAKDSLDWAGLPVTLPRWFVDYFYETLSKIKHILIKKPHASHAQILQEVHPLIYYYYEEAKKTWITLDWLLDLAFPEDAKNQDIFQLKDVLSPDLLLKIDDLLPKLKNKIQQIFKGSDALHIECIKELPDLPPLIKILKPILWNYYEANKIPINLAGVYKEYIQCYKTSYLSIEAMLGELLNEQLPLSHEELDNELKKVDTFLENTKKKGEISVKIAIQNFISKIKLEQLPIDEQLKVAKELLSFYQIDPQLFPDGITPLHLAARTGSVGVVDWLIQQGVPLENISAEGKTALDEAVESNNDSVIKELICNGATVCQDTKKTVDAFETYLERTRILSHAERMKLFRLPIYQQASPAGHRLAEPASYQYLLTSIRGFCLPEKANAVPPKFPDLKATLQLPGSSTLLFLQQQVIEQLIITNPKHKRFGYLREEQNAARKKLGILSNHTVVCVESNGYYLSLKEKPTHPVMDFAVHLLRMRLSGHGSPPNTLGKLTITYNNKIISYPVLISLTVPGENLNQILQNNNRPIYINRKIFSDLMLFDMTASPGDGSASNYIDQESPENDIVDSIDEDQYFIEPVTKLTRGQRIDSKSILRCLPQAKDAAPYSSMQNWISLSLKVLLNEYLQDVDNYQKDCAALFDEIEVKRLNAEDKNNLFTPHLLIREGTVAQLLLNAIFIQGQLRVAMLENKPISLMELQTRINFPLGMAHQAALDNNTMTPQQRLVNVTGKSLPSLTSRQSLEACLKEIPSEEELRQPKKFTLKNAMTELELLKNVLLDNKILIHNEQNTNNELIVRANFDSIKDRNKQNLLLRILIGFSYTKLEITHSEVLSDNLLEAILSQSQQLTYLDVRYCPRLTAASVRFLAKHCPNLEILYLSGTGIQELIDQPAELFANALTEKLAATSLVFPKLKKLHIAHCENLRFIDIDAPLLQTLKAKDCKKLENIKLKTPQLTQLDFCKCDALREIYPSIFAKTIIEVRIRQKFTTLGNIESPSDKVKFKSWVHDLIVNHIQTESERQKSLNIFTDAAKILFLRIIVSKFLASTSAEKLMQAEWLVMADIIKTAIPVLTQILKNLDPRSEDIKIAEQVKHELRDILYHSVDQDNRNLENIIATSYKLLNELGEDFSPDKSEMLKTTIKKTFSYTTQVKYKPDFWTNRDIFINNIPNAELKKIRAIAVILKRNKDAAEIYFLTFEGNNPELVVKIYIIALLKSSVFNPKQSNNPIQEIKDKKHAIAHTLKNVLNAYLKYLFPNSQEKENLKEQLAALDNLCTWVEAQHERLIISEAAKICFDETLVMIQRKKLTKDAKCFNETKAKKEGNLKAWGPYEIVHKLDSSAEEKIASEVEWKTREVGICILIVWQTNSLYSSPDYRKLVIDSILLRYKGYTKAWGRYTLGNASSTQKFVGPQFRTGVLSNKKDALDIFEMIINACFDSKILDSYGKYGRSAELFSYLINAKINNQKDFAAVKDCANHGVRVLLSHRVKALRSVFGYLSLEDVKKLQNWLDDNLRLLLSEKLATKQPKFAQPQPAPKPRELNSESTSQDIKQTYTLRFKIKDKISLERAKQFIQYSEHDSVSRLTM